MSARDPQQAQAPRHVQVHVHEHTHQVSLALVQAELQRSGPPPKLPVLEAIIRHAPREPAVARLVQMLDAPPPPGPGSTGAHAVMYAALGLLRLSAREPAALAALERFARRLGGAAGAVIDAGVVLLRDGTGPLLQAGTDSLLLRQAPLALCALAQPGAELGEIGPLCACWAEALRSGQKKLGVQALRAYLGDVAEALYRVQQRLRPEGGIAALLTEGDRGFFYDTITFELPGTADFLAARAMVWLLGLLGPLDDAAIAAIERARDRFRNEAFHGDCALILSGGPWPPAGAG